MLELICMNKSELAPLIDSLLPHLYSFAYCLIPDELQAEQLVLDAYSVFLIREREHLSEWEADRGRRERAETKKFLLNDLLGDVYELGAKRAFQLLPSLENKSGPQAFYRLQPAQRAALCLKENLKKSHEDIEAILAMKKHKVIELLYNARAGLRANSEREGALL